MNVEKLIRKNILSLKPYTSARDQYSEGILLDANENSMGSTAPGFEDLKLNRYPDPHQEDLRNVIGGYLGVRPESLFFGVGSDEIIDLLIRIFCEPRMDSVMILDPTYGMYKVACDINDVEAIPVSLDEEFQINFDDVDAKYAEDVKIIFVCSPNNPTGNLLRKEDILRLCRDYNSIIAVDEAYVDFAGDNSVIKEVNNFPNLVVMRTFSKAWGLAGIRLGYCAAGDTVIDYLFKVKAPYNVNQLTRHAVINAVGNHEQKDRFVEELISERERVKQELETMAGIQKVFPSDANYLLFRCSNASEVQKRMADDGIIIRDRSSYAMLDNCLRVTIGTKEENDKFLNSLRRYVS